MNWSNGQIPPEALHQLAKDLFNQASVARLLGLRECGGILQYQSADVERMAAHAAVDTPDRPFRSELLFTAAWRMACCDRLAEFEALIAEGLAGHPPEDLASKMAALRSTVRERARGNHPRAERGLLTPTPAVLRYMAQQCPVCLN